jgi:hypothetical protein
VLKTVAPSRPGDGHSAHLVVGRRPSVVDRRPWQRQADLSEHRWEEKSMAGRYEYKVEEIREGMIGGKMSGDKLEKVLNQRAAEGWQLKAITSVEVKGRMGPGGVEGVLVTFERPVA